MAITALYAALMTMLFIGLSARVITVRRAKRIEIGTAAREGEDRQLLRRVRVHANFVEYAPLALILMGLAESLKALPVVLHALGIALLIGRIAHAYGLSQSPHNMPLRVAGMVLTLTMMAGAAALCLWLSVGAAT
jgi:uncharacterized protein